MSRLAAILSALTLITCPGSAQQSSSAPPINDTPPALSLPPLKELPPPPSLSPAQKKPAAAPVPPPSTPSAPPPPPSTVPSTPQAPPPSVAAKERLSGKAAPAPLPASSSSGTFSARGGDLKTRTLMLQRCETIGAEVHNLLQDTPTDGQKPIPITINIRSAPDLNPKLPAVYPNITQLDWGGFDLLITVQARPDFNPNDFRTELVRLLIVERILRGHKSITPRGGILPDWLLVGINEALDYRSRNKPSALFAAVFRTGKVFGIEEILDVNLSNLDALSRAIYNTSCCALVLTLLDQPDGSLRLAKLLNALPTTDKSNRELIAEWFPNLALSASSLDKWWALQMANLSRPSVFETLGPAETAAALESALYFRYESTSESSPTRSRPSVASTPEPEPKTEPAAEEEPKKVSGIIRNFFRRDKKEENTTEEPTAPPAKPEKEKEPSKEKPKDKEKEPAATRDDGPGILGRLFFGDPKKQDEPKEDKKDKEKSADKPAAKKETSFALPDAILHSASPLLALLNDQFAASTGGRYTVTIFGLGKKKTPEEIAAEKAEDEKKAAEKQKAEEERAKAKADEKAKEAAEKAKRDADREKARAEKDAAKKAKDEPKEESDEKAKEKETPKSAPEPEPEAPRPVKPRTRTSNVSVPIDEYAKIVSRKDLKSICSATAANLTLLHRRAHPLFRPIITQYIAVVAAIADGKTKEVPAALAELKIARTQALAQAKAVQDHLDFLEASGTKNYTGQFDDYLRLPETIKKELPPRTDIITKTLDEMEAKR